MNVKAWAASQGISYATARRWFEAGKLPVPAYQAGPRIVIGEPVPASQPGVTVVYARVSSADQKPDLDRQVARVTTWATGQHLPVDQVVTEVGSAVNGRRGKFLILLRDPSVTRIMVEHRNRLAYGITRGRPDPGHLEVPVFAAQRLERRQGQRQTGTAYAGQTGTGPPQGRTAA